MCYLRISFKHTFCIEYLFLKHYVYVNNSQTRRRSERNQMVLFCFVFLIRVCRYLEHANESHAKTIARAVREPFFFDSNENRFVFQVCIDRASTVFI